MTRFEVKIKVIAFAVITIAFVGLWLANAHGQSHQSLGRGISPQLLITHPDIALSAGASPTSLASPSPKTGYFLVQNTGSNPAQLGDSLVSTSQGVLLQPNGEAIPIPANNGLYEFSDSGTPISLSEINLP
jgi:hypothetical protein